MPAPMISVYALTKAAVMMITRSTAFEGGEHGVRANAIAPGWIVTPMVAHYWTNEDGTEDDTRKREIVETRKTQSPLRMPSCSIVGTALGGTAQSTS